jgi:hypothetical protein
MAITPGTSKVVKLPATQVFSSSSTIASYTLNPCSPLEAGRQVVGNGVLDRATNGSSISGATAT